MAAWFSANVGGGGGGVVQPFKLGSDESVTKWTADPGNPGFPDQGLDPIDLTFFNNALWFQGDNAGSDVFQLYKLGSDGSVTKWTSLPGVGFGLAPQNLTVFN